MSGRYAMPLAAIVLVALAVAAALTLPRQGPVAASPSPSPSPTAKPTTSSTPSASPATSPTATPSPSPAASAGGDRFVNALAGYSVEVPPPWRRSDCFSGVSGSGSDATASDTFLEVSAYDEESGHTGIPYDLIEVHARPNPDDLTPRQWWDGGRTVWPRESFSRVTDTTIAGRPALRIDDSPHEGVLVASDTHMFEIRSRERNNAQSGRLERAAIIATFRLLTEEELAAARARPTPVPAPARTAEQVADVLADGFARKDTSLLASVIQPHCVTVAVAQGGGSSLSSEKYLDELEARFARGLTVEVRRSSMGPAQFFQDGTLALQSTWKEPGQQDVEVDLLISPERTDRWSWRGALLFFVGR
jgi:hypothetical protein